MADNVIVSPLTNLEGSSAVQKVNENFNKLAEAFDKVLWKDGKEEVDNDLDLNGRKILNVGDPVGPTDLVRVKDLSGLISDVVFPPIRSNSFDSVVELAASNVENISAVLAEEGKAGTFTIRDYADFIDEVAADTSQVNFIRSNSDPSKVWVRTTILEFGASQIGTTSGQTVQDILDDTLTVDELIVDDSWDAIVATQGQTVFTFTGSTGLQTILKINGIEIEEVSDYTRSGDSYTLLTPASAGDIVELEALPVLGRVPSIAFDTFQSIRNALPLNLLDFCTSEIQRQAVLAGVVGIDVPLAVAIPYAASVGKSIDVPPSQNYVTSLNAVIENPNGVPINFNNSKIRKIGRGPLFRTGTAASPVMTGGRLVAGTTLSGSQSVTLDSGQAAPFYAGQWVFITDRTRIFSLANNVRGEVLRILKVEGDVVTFWSPLRFDYLGGTVSGGYARIVPAPYVEGASYKNLVVEMDTSVDLTLYRGNNAFHNRWLFGATFENIVVRNFIEIGIYLESCATCTIDNYRAVNGGSATTGSSDPTSTEGLPGFSYGTAEAGLCFGNKINSNCIGINLRHFYSTLSLVPNNGVTEDYGEPTASNISGTAIFPKNAGFDTHESGYGITFDNCKVYGGHFVGMQIRCTDVTINHFECLNTVGAAVWNRGGATTSGDNAYANRTVVNRVIARYTNQGVSFDGTDWRERGAFADEASNTRGGEIIAMYTGGPALTLYRNGGNNGAHWKKVTGLFACRKAVTNKFLVHIPSAFSSGIVIEEIHNVGDGNVVNLIRGNGAGGSVRNLLVSSGNHSGQTFLFTGGMTLTNSLGNITGLQGVIDDFENRISALEA